jgi:SAM-dependent methyltransferase
VTLLQPSTFGSGGREPYANALSRSDTGPLRLVDLETETWSSVDVSRWCADADAADLTMLRGVSGPVLDVGCGPGRMVRAALDLGLPTLGVDVSAAAVRLAHRSGLPVLHRSIFEPLPHAGWSTILLADGNIGIGGDPAALLVRCAELLAGDGAIVVEVSPDPTASRRYRAQVRDAAGRVSEEFPWAEVGIDALDAPASAAGLVVAQSWSAGDRRFARLESTSR